MADIARNSSPSNNDRIYWQPMRGGYFERRRSEPDWYGKIDLKHKVTALYGRCRSGKRWFWFTSTYGAVQKELEGWADTEAAALDAARDAVITLAGDFHTVAVEQMGNASWRLREINKAKRAARPVPDTSEARPVEYLYTWSGKHQIIKKTKTRIYYNKHEADWWQAEKECDLGFVDRAEVELPDDQTHWCDRKGRHTSRFFFLRPPVIPEPKPPDLAQLKAEMAAAHPDRGGSNAAFIEARKRYVEARRLLRTIKQTGGKHDRN